jgi:hypothetical protein
MSTRAVRRDNIPAKVKVAITYLLEVKDDLKAAAEHAQISLSELRRYMGKPQVRRYSLEQRQIALERFCLGSPAALTRVRDESENGIAVVNAVKAGELLRLGAVQEGATAERRAPGLQIVIVERDGSQHIAHQPPPLLDVTPSPEAELVPSDRRRRAWFQGVAARRPSCAPWCASRARLGSGRT